MAKIPKESVLSVPNSTLGRLGLLKASNTLLNDPGSLNDGQDLHLQLAFALLAERYIFNNWRLVSEVLK